MHPAKKLWERFNPEVSWLNHSVGEVPTEFFCQPLVFPADPLQVVRSDHVGSDQSDPLGTISSNGVDPSVIKRGRMEAGKIIEVNMGFPLAILVIWWILVKDEG